METRKLIQQGASRLTITLPQDWIAKHGLVKGEQVRVSETPEGALLIEAIK